MQNICISKIYGQKKRKQILRVWVSLWQVSLCSCASSACLQLERRSSVFSLSVCSLPCYLGREHQEGFNFYNTASVSSCVLLSCFQLLYLPHRKVVVTALIRTAHCSLKKDRCCWRAPTLGSRLISNTSVWPKISLLETKLGPRKVRTTYK